MATMQHSTVQRSGVTVNHWNWETDKCSASATDQDLLFRFDIASKGGGRTDILLTVGKVDIPLVLDELAKSIPEAIEWMAASITKARAAQRAGLALARKEADGLSEEAETATARAHALYLAAPSDDDDQEGELHESLKSMSSAIRILKGRLDAI